MSRVVGAVILGKGLLLAGGWGGAKGAAGRKKDFAGGVRLREEPHLSAPEFHTPRRLSAFDDDAFFDRYTPQSRCRIEHA